MKIYSCSTEDLRSSKEIELERIAEDCYIEEQVDEQLLKLSNLINQRANNMISYIYYDDSFAINIVKEIEGTKNYIRYIDPDLKFVPDYMKKMFKEE